MKSLHRILWVVFLMFLLGCPQPQQNLTAEQKEGIQKEVRDRFQLLVAAINRSDVDAWSGHYSKDGFASAIAGVDMYDSRSAWVEIVTNYFSLRERQRVDLDDVRVTALTADLALMTSRERSEMRMKSRENVLSRHVFTMIWKKEADGWKIVHSHESWRDGEGK